MAMLWRFRFATGQRQAAAWLYEAKLEASTALLETVFACTAHSTGTAICPTAVEALCSIMRSCLWLDVWLSCRSMDDYFTPQSTPRYRTKPLATTAPVAQLWLNLRRPLKIEKQGTLLI
jgi:hypothetical protein